MKCSGVINSVTLIDHLDEDLDFCLVTMEDFNSYNIFDNYNNLLKFVGKDVEFVTRKDVYKGSVMDVVVQFNVKEVIQSKATDEDDIFFTEEHKSLIPEFKTERMDIVDFDSKSLKVGDIKSMANIYIYNCRKGKSPNARWLDFECLDMYSKKFNLRLFFNVLEEDNVESFMKNCIGRYVNVTIKNTKYGLQAEGDMEILSDFQHKMPPEVFLAKVRLNSIINSDGQLKGYCDKFDLVQTLENIIYYEPGYHLMEMAIEFMLITTLSNIYEDCDRKLLRRAVVASRGYLLGNKHNRSIPVVNYHRILQSELKNDNDLIDIIDVTSSNCSWTKRMFYEIKRLSKIIMEGIRDSESENDINTALSSIEQHYGRVFWQP